MFDFALKYFGFLKHIPLFPHLFEAWMKIEKTVTDKNIPDYLDEIEKEVLLWERTSARIHKFGGIQFDVNKKEIGHIHSNGLLDILFTREIKNELIKNGKVKDHHVFKNSGWISFRIRKEEDKKTAIALLEKSYQLKIER